jgi:hypothetical protein
LKSECRVELRVIVRDWKGISFVLGAAINLRHHKCLLKSSKFSVCLLEHLQRLANLLERFEVSLEYSVETYPWASAMPAMLLIIN